MRIGRASWLVLGATFLWATQGVAAAGAKPPAAPPRTRDVIALHVGVTGEAYLGQPLADFLAHFPGAHTEPYAKQTDVIRVKVPKEGITAVAMGETPASMTVESIGFNFAEPYEGIDPGTRRTVEGIGGGSNVNELLETYGKPAESKPEKRGAAGSSGEERVRHVYRSADGAVTSSFVVEGSRVLRVVMTRSAAVDRFLLKRAPG